MGSDMAEMAAGKLLQQFIGGDMNLAVTGAELGGNDVGVLEFVALLAIHGLKADRERVQAIGTGLRHQANQQARIDSTRQQYTDIHRGQLALAHRQTQLLQQALAPFLETALFVARIAIETQATSSCAPSPAPSASIVMVVAGAIFCTPLNDGVARRHHGSESSGRS